MLKNKIKEAYEATGLVPINNQFICQNGRCGLSVLYEYEEGPVCDNRLVVDWACDKFGSDFVLGFIHGFDQKKAQELKPDYLNGYKQGNETWNLVSK